MALQTNAQKISSVRYLGNYPSNKSGTWTESLQGVGNDSSNWFFTQEKALWKVPLNINLNNTENLQPNSSWPGVHRIAMPDLLKRQGFDHFGDLDVRGNYIFVPIERSASQEPAIGVFRADNLTFLDYAILPDKTRSGWVSIAPNGELFTSHNKVDSTNPIDVYKLDWDLLRRSGELNLRWARHFDLTGIPREFGRGLSTFMQGGDFSDDGQYLFLVNGRVGDPTSEFSSYLTHSRGIWIFRNNDYHHGDFVMKSVQSGSNFRYEYRPELFEEPEGITYWDIDSKDPHGPGGQLHAILLDKAFDADDIWLKHYSLVRSTSDAQALEVRWERLSGSDEAEKIATCFNRYLYKVDDENTLWVDQDGRSPLRWQRVRALGQTVRSLTCAAGTVYYLDKHNDLNYVSADNRIERIGQPYAARDIAGTEDATLDSAFLYALNRGDNTLWENYSGGVDSQWSKVGRPWAASRIAATQDALFALNRDKTLWINFEGGKDSAWQKIDEPFAAKEITATTIGQSGQIALYAVNNDGSIWKGQLVD